MWVLWAGLVVFIPCGYCNILPLIYKGIGVKEKQRNADIPGNNKNKMSQQAETN